MLLLLRLLFRSIPLLLDHCIPHRTVQCSVHSTFILSIIYFMVICVLSQSRFVWFFFLSSLEMSQMKKCFSFWILILIAFAKVCVCMFVNLVRFDIKFWFCLGSRSARPVSDCHQKWMLLQVSVNNLRQSISNRFFFRVFVALYYWSFVFATVNRVFFLISETIILLCGFFSVIVAFAAAAAFEMP